MNNPTELQHPSEYTQRRQAEDESGLGEAGSAITMNEEGNNVGLWSLRNQQCITRWT